ncbi:MAG: hypothetical protein K0041_08235, partial [Acidithiobacillus sp.]|nr:hypothetical protein [Acidithiobacillus sp.]
MTNSKLPIETSLLSTASINSSKKSSADLSSSSKSLGPDSFESQLRTAKKNVHTDRPTAREQKTETKRTTPSASENLGIPVYASISLPGHSIDQNPVQSGKHATEKVEGGSSSAVTVDRIGKASTKAQTDLVHVANSDAAYRKRHLNLETLSDHAGNKNDKLAVGESIGSPSHPAKDTDLVHVANSDAAYRKRHLNLETLSDHAGNKNDKLAVGESIGS